MKRIIVLYCWGATPLSPEKIQAAGDCVNATHVCVAGNLINGGLQKTLVNIPAAIPFIIQPSPFCGTTTPQVAPSAADFSTCAKELIALKDLYGNRFQGVKVAHEVFIRDPQALDWLHRTVGFCEWLEVEPILLMDSPDFERTHGAAYKEFEPRCSVTANTHSKMWVQNSATKAWGWNGKPGLPSEADVRSLVGDRRKMIESLPRVKRPFDAVLLQAGFDSTFTPEATYWTFNKPSPAEWWWTLDALAGMENIEYWLGNTEGNWVGLLDAPDLADAIRAVEGMSAETRAFFAPVISDVLSRK